jgi:Uma2 family endonuclease
MTMAQQTIDATDATTASERRLAMSFEEFLAWDGEAIHAEWVAGEVIVFMPAALKHQMVIGLLYRLLSDFVERFDLGLVLLAPFAMRALPDGPAREPDLLFVAREHLDRLTPQLLVGPADLAIEIISDSSLRRDRADKFYEYQRAGVREYWLFDPRPGEERTDFYRLTAEGKYLPVLPDEQGRYHSSVLPGFWLDPAWLWQEPPPSARQLLATIAPPARRAGRDVPGATGDMDRSGA